MSNMKIVKTFPGGANALTQYSCVDTAAGVVVTTAATDTALGIVENGYDASAPEVAVCIFGITRARAHDGSIAVGELLELAAAGRVDTHDGTSTKPVVGLALEASSAQDDEIEIFLFPQSDAGPAA